MFLTSNLEPLITVLNYLLLKKEGCLILYEIYQLICSYQMYPVTTDTTSCLPVLNYQYHNWWLRA